MKRIIALLLSLIMVLSLCACGKKNLTLEDLTSMYVQYDDTRVTFSFEDGTMSVKIIHYVESASSPSGKIAGKEEKYTIPYTRSTRKFSFTKRISRSTFPLVNGWRGLQSFVSKPTMRINAS